MRVRWLVHAGGHVGTLGVATPAAWARASTLAMGQGSRTAMTMRDGAAVVRAALCSEERLSRETSLVPTYYAVKGCVVHSVTMGGDAPHGLGAEEIRRGGEEGATRPHRSQAAGLRGRVGTLRRTRCRTSPGLSESPSLIPPI